jgi:hypothetical protein
MEKTIKEWYTELPANVQEKALNNLSNDAGEVMTIDLFDAICQGFTWSNSPEGEEYWKRIVKPLLIPHIKHKTNDNE